MTRKMPRAVEYLILRDLEAEGRNRIDMPKKSVRVPTMLNEEKFQKEK